DLNPGPPAP
ncbi:hypothetical protein A2U01_0074483, partial [Trifolium medium]|nr:hypothetical protein [Trifolium medium]